MILKKEVIDVENGGLYHVIKKYSEASDKKASPTARLITWITLLVLLFSLLALVVGSLVDNLLFAVAVSLPLCGVVAVYGAGLLKRRYSKAVDRLMSESSAKRRREHIGYLTDEEYRYFCLEYIKKAMGREIEKKEPFYFCGSSPIVFIGEGGKGLYKGRMLLNSDNEGIIIVCKTEDKAAVKEIYGDAVRLVVTDGDVADKLDILDHEDGGTAKPRFRMGDVINKNTARRLYKTGAACVLLGLTLYNIRFFGGMGLALCIMGIAVSIMDTIKAHK